MSDTNYTQPDAQAPIRKQEKQPKPTASACKKNPHAVAMGELGGKSGVGESKRRSPEHYKRMVELRWGKKTE